MIRNNSVLFATIALVAVMAMAGSASAIEPVSGDVNSTVAEGNVVTLTVEGGTPGRYVTAVVGNNVPLDDYAYSNIDPLLVDANILSGGLYNATIVMLCSGTQCDENGVMGADYTNTFRNTTPTTAYIVNAQRNGATDFASLMELEPCPIIDLNVSEISVNPSCKPGTLRANTTNEICAKIMNDGTAAAGQFNVSFVVTGSSGGYSKEVTVTGLGAGNNTTVCITDYQPTSPGAVTINVTADCDLVVGESDEGNNSMVESATVYNNGYMGKRLTGGEGINLVTKEEGRIDIKYAVCNTTTYVNATGTHDFGDNQTYLSGGGNPNWTEYRARWDKTLQCLSIPSGETIRKATLYVYYTTSYYPVPDFNVSFNGMNYTMANAVHRTDVKGWPSTSEYSNAPAGMLTYDVTSKFANTTNTMVVYNLLEPGSAAPPATKHQITLQGAVLAVVYEHSSEPERIIYVNEGFDLLAGASYSCCTPDEATAYADFLNVPNPALFVDATLVTISTGADKGPGKNKLFFNNDEWDGGLKNGTFPTDAGWAPPAVASWMDITANETDVYGSLLEGSNTARFQDSGDLFCMANAFLKLEKGDPDLNVSAISVNPSCKPGTLRANTTNEICAKIVNDGTAAAGQFNVRFVVTGSPGGYSKEVTVTGLGAGNNTTVCITDYQPTSPGAVAINVTADCDLVVGESDEGNNSMVESATVYNNGYMGKRWTGGEDINLVTKEEGRIDIKYAVCNATTYIDGTGMQHDFGDNQTYLSGSTYPNWTEYRARWDKDPQLPIPSGETIKKAKLYVYYTTSYYPVPDFNVSFNGMNYTMANAVHRTDVKGWPSTSEYSNAPAGMLTYDVTSKFANTTNTMVVYNLMEPGSAAPPATKHQITLQGAVLAVVYEHSSEPERIIYVNEGFDLLAGASYSCCTPDEATAYADFLNVPNPALFVDATLVTISTGADKGPGENKLFFNNDEWDGGLKNGTFPTDEGWAPPAVASWMDITANETDVYGSLLEGSNTARFQDSGDLFCMANAFLKLEKGDPDLNVSAISVNPSCKPGTLRANTTNEICAKIVNDGTAAAGQFNVRFVVTGSPGGYSKEVTVTGLGAGNNTTVCITDYQPTSPGAVAINVTADCDLVVGESDEGNNSMVESATVYNNGYMGKRWTGGEDINLVTKEEGRIDIKYAVCNATTYIDGTGMQHDFGDNQTYLSGSTYPNWTEYRARWDKDPQLPIPSGETIKKAKLYVYYTTSYYTVPDFNVSFNGMNYTMANAVHRTDVKGWPSTSEYSNAPAGMLTYDVTSKFANTTNTMVVCNLLEPGSAAPPATKHQITLQGAVLAVVYEHSSEPERIIYVNEGFDLLVSTYYSCCTPDEATAYAYFLNVPNPALFVDATLVTISTGADKGHGKNKLFFNNDEWDGGLKNGTFPTDEGWAPPAVASWMDITANETDVLGSLSEGSNTARFQDSGDLFCMANAFLKLEKGEGPKPDGGGGGGGGTYPPGWFGTPTPTVTATKAPAATPTATAAPPGERVTPAPTKAKPTATKATARTAEETTAEKPAKGAPGFTAVFVIAGMLAVAYAMMRRRE